MDITAYRMATFSGEPNPNINYHREPVFTVRATESGVFSDALTILRKWEPYESYLRRSNLVYPSQPTLLFHTLNLVSYNGGALKLSDLAPDIENLLFEQYEIQARALIEASKEASEITGLKSLRTKKARFGHLKQKLESLSEDYFYLESGVVTDFDDAMLTEERPTWLVENYAVKLPWNAVRIKYYDRLGEYKGYFVAMAWVPATHELVFAGPDFVPEGKYRRPPNITVPRGCSYPLDSRATQANCGLSAFSALVGLSTERALEYLPIWKKKPYLLWSDLSNGLNRLGWKPEKIWVTRKGRTMDLSQAFGVHKKGMILIMFSKAGKSVGIGHWAAYANHQVYDINARDQDRNWGSWVPEKIWLEKIVPTLFRGAGADNFYISTILVPGN